MVNLITVVVMLLMLGILVVVHEWGHFIVARIFGIRVDEFSIGFGPLALRVAKRGDTEYNIRWVPLGGYVKIAGMEADEEPINYAKDRAKSFLGNDDPNAGEIPLVAENTADHAETEEQRLRDEKDGFYSKPIWQRSLVIFAGPFMSFLFGVIIFCNIGWITGWPVQSNEVGQTVPGSPAVRAGLQNGDRIVKINGTPTPTFDSVVTIIHGSIGKQLLLTVDRNHADMLIKATPQVRMKENTSIPDLVNGKPQGMLGFTPSLDATQRLSFINSQRVGLLQTQLWLQQIELIFSHVALIQKNTGSLLSMTSMTHSAVEKGAQRGSFWILNIAASITLSLALFNLLPIPILDGGHLLTFAIEALRRGRRLTPAQQQNFMLAGLVTIGLLVVAVWSREIMNAINGKLPKLP